MTKAQVVVLTPVRNESWILSRFLTVTSHFADHILVAYQDSSDDSLEICRRYRKVTVIENLSRDFNEADRQTLLVERARRIVPGPKVLVALDADEILAFSVLRSSAWTRMLESEPGTVVEFHFVELLPNMHECISYAKAAPVAYVDDGAAHVTKAIHSTRIPTPSSARHLMAKDIHVMHYALTRPYSCAAKHRFYAVIENILRTSHVLQRRHTYATVPDWRANPRLEELGGCVEATPSEWLSGWEELGIDMRTIQNEDIDWRDLAVLELFRQYGTTRFWLEPIWEFDWQALQRKISRSPDVNGRDLILAPPALVGHAMRLLDGAYTQYARARRNARSL